MKKIYSFIFFAIALLAFAPVSKALDDDPPYVEKDGLCYNKTVGKPNTSGVYTITLESFVTGSVQLKNESMPADIVLVLDISQSMTDSYNGSTRLAALQTAVSDFLEVIYHNDNYKTADNSSQRDEPLGNRISVVTFGGDQGASATQIRSGLTAVTTGTDRAKNTSIISYISGLNNNSINNNRGTYADEGMTYANQVLNGIDADRKKKASRTVVLFTDGAPGSGPGWTSGTGTTSSAGTATRTIAAAYTTKNTHTAKVYTVILGDYPSGNNGVSMRNYLQYVSSNYPDATTLTNGGNKTTEEGADYAKEAGADLSGVFTTIAQASGGSEMDLTDATISQVDVVSTSFTLPHDFTGMSAADIQAWADANIKIYTAPYLGTQDAEGYLQFGAKIPKGSNTATYKEREKDSQGHVSLVGEDKLVDGSLSVKLSASASAPAGKLDVIEVTGFDYGNNFCGPDDLMIDYNGHNYNGHKVIIEIPIKMDPNAVGGPDCKTNGPNSGLFVKDADGNVTVSIPFEMEPVVSLPVNIHIRKEGLEEGESAKFKIQRKYLKDSDATGTNAWEDVTSVFVTRHKNQAADGTSAPITKVVGMPSTDEDDKPFVYQVVEEPWSWSYTSSALTETTTDKLVRNPFIFSNQKKDNIDVKIRNAESKVTNTFKTGEGAAYDDSKDNNRTVITVGTQTGGQESGGSGESGEGGNG